MGVGTVRNRATSRYREILDKRSAVENAINAAKAIARQNYNGSIIGAVVCAAMVVFPSMRWIADPYLVIFVPVQALMFVRYGLALWRRRRAMVEYNQCLYRISQGRPGHGLVFYDAAAKKPMVE